MSPLNITQPLGSIRYIRSIMATIFGDVQYTQNGTVTIPSGIPSVTVCSPKKKVSWMRITSCQSMNSICQLPISPIWRIPIKGYQLTYQTAEQNNITIFRPHRPRRPRLDDGFPHRLGVLDWCQVGSAVHQDAAAQHAIHDVSPVTASSENMFVLFLENQTSGKQIRFVG